MQRFWEHLKHHFVPSHHNAYQPHLLRRSWLLFFLSLTLIAEGFLATNLMVRQSSETFLAAVVPAEVIALTNSERHLNGLGTLVSNRTLTYAAQEKANDMVAKSYFAHQGPDGKKPWDWMLDAGYSYRYAGENLAVRFVDSHDVVQAWMASPTHRANIVKPVYTQIGIGVANGSYQGTQATYVVQFFATPLFGSGKQVAGAAGAVPSNATGVVLQKVLSILGRLQAEPVSTTNTILGVIALILILVLLFTVFVHYHVQPTHMVGTGAAVLGVVVLLCIANTQLLGPSDTGQSAAVLYGDNAWDNSVVLGGTATSTEVVMP